MDQKFGGEGRGKGRSSACCSSLGPGQGLVGPAGLSSLSGWEEGPLSTASSQFYTGLASSSSGGGARLLHQPPQLWP